MLHYVPENRISAKDALLHPWFKIQIEQTVASQTEHLGALNNLKDF